jgi:hypothetical protein
LINTVMLIAIIIANVVTPGVASRGSFLANIGTVSLFLELLFGLALPLTVILHKDANSAK